MFGASEAVGGGAGTRRAAPRRAAAPGNHPIQRDAFASEICSCRDWENRMANRYYVVECLYHDKSYESYKETWRKPSILIAEDDHRTVTAARL